MIDDSSLSDGALYRYAQQHLKVLDDPWFVRHNRPSWVDRTTGLSGTLRARGGYTTTKMFTAMFKVADELKLYSGRRYVSAAVCACALDAAKGTGADVDQNADLRLARLLEGLANTWVAYMLWPC